MAQDRAGSGGDATTGGLLASAVVVVKGRKITDGADAAGAPVGRIVQHTGVCGRRRGNATLFTGDRVVGRLRVDHRGETAWQGRAEVRVSRTAPVDAPLAMLLVAVGIGPARPPRTGDSTNPMP
ncbi:MAG: hypothetical protein ACRD0A_21220 [Acidimicrobiales bacterium]